VNPVPRPTPELGAGVPIAHFISSCLTRDRAELKIRPLGQRPKFPPRVRGTLDTIGTYAD
jgi:hypothetical protein